MRMKKAWKIIRKINSDEIKFGDLPEKEQDQLFKAVQRLIKKYVILSNINMMKDVIKIIAITIIILLGINIIIELFTLFTNF